MPIYCYKCPDGHASQEYFHLPKPPRSIQCPVCSKRATRNRSAEHVHTDMVSRPRTSEAMGVMPHQIEEAMRRFPGSRYTPDGALCINNRKHKKMEMKRRGYVELD